jgi:hypothetical protein
MRPFKKSTAPPDEGPWGKAIEHAVKKALRWPTMAIRVLAGVCIALILVAGASGYEAYQAHEQAIQLKTDSITSCESGNTFRTGQTEIWEKNYALQAKESAGTATLLTQLIDTLTGNNPTRIKEVEAILEQSGKASAAETATFLAYVKSVNVPHNCVQTYSVKGN